MGDCNFIKSLKKMKELTLGSFKRKGAQGSFGHYFTYRNEEEGIELCLESCFNGYEVALYDLNQELLVPKKCTDIKGMLEAQIAPGFSIMTGEALEKALKMANVMMSEYLENKVKK